MLIEEKINILRNVSNDKSNVRSNAISNDLSGFEANTNSLRAMAKSVVYSAISTYSGIISTPQVWKALGGQTLSYL